MFRHQSPKASLWKHVIHLASATTLGLLLSLITHAVLEMLYLQSAEKQGALVVWHGGYALPWVIQYFLWALGGIGGFLVGRFWWRKIYVEKVWCQRNGSKK